MTLTGPQKTQMITINMGRAKRDNSLKGFWRVALFISISLIQMLVHFQENNTDITRPDRSLSGFINKILHVWTDP